MQTERILLGKVIISGTLECLTGLHIGASKENMEIGAIDSPVVRDPVTREPYIPGSSLKGKLRALLEKALCLIDRRDIGTRNNPVKIHVCEDAAKAHNCQLCRIFGSTGYNGGKNFPARLIVRDLRLTAESRDKLEDIDTGLQYTEWKFENAIDRITSAANPRQLERVPRGAEFDFELIYNVEDVNQMKEDIENIKLAISITEADALGGHGSRGYGKVKFNIKGIAGKTIEGFKDKTLVIGNKTIDSVERIKDIYELFQNKKTESQTPVAAST
ncbi:MAG: type III-A CRISPR-associated RAMP protein Csm3 [Candidatus Loosdrechtia sp.]|uniref:type III-A CRISPR-associated RAMP protein Csm3 n=1 Tax=Candidatus Loosdrechtia sp. TaxID=3101272 RepID=UPI003A6FE455|nr:MAG: type III-A CRISPR-associated RAMP protein Csm3 [Candidatus Jettenia sp. AMX2]